MLRNGAGGHSAPMPASAAPTRVFIADDSALIYQRVSAMLTAAGMEVVGRAESPLPCFASILATHPDVVVLDVHLHGGAGLEVLRTVRLAVPEIAFVVFSNNSGPAYRKRYLGEGALEFLDKSTQFDQLAGAVARAGRHVTH
jgi:DNA-binding NarL/FixJ family response regulator